MYTRQKEQQKSFTTLNAKKKQAKSRIFQYWVGKKLILLKICPQSEICKNTLLGGTCIEHLIFAFRCKNGRCKTHSVWHIFNCGNPKLTSYLDDIFKNPNKFTQAEFPYEDFRLQCINFNYLIRLLATLKTSIKMLCINVHKLF